MGYKFWVNLTSAGVKVHENAAGKTALYKSSKKKSQVACEQIWGSYRPRDVAVFGHGFLREECLFKNDSHFSSIVKKNNKKNKGEYITQLKSVLNIFIINVFWKKLGTFLS